MNKPIKYLLLVILSALALPSAAQSNLFKDCRIESSSQDGDYTARRAVDGIVSRESAWISAPASRPPHILEVTMPAYCDIDSVVICTGIPVNEMKESEKGRNPGFWGAKNFMVQYWDDANWTDIPGTMTTENGEERVVFKFAKSITSFRFRIFSTDGEPIRIMEFEGYGRKNNSLSAPQFQAGRGGTATIPYSNVMIRVKPEITGTSMKYVGYNQGYLLPGGNALSWIEYSGVNSVRLWAPPQVYIKPEWFIDRTKVENLPEFERSKSAFRADPAGGKFVMWDSVAVMASRVVPSTNTMVLDYALNGLKKLGVDVILQASPLNRCKNWSEKWLQWRAFYSFAFYLARHGDVRMMALQNEPNHRNAGPVPLDEWIEMMRICSDAQRCAVEDVNRIYGKNLVPMFVGPVTAGTNTDWWASVSAAVRKDYRGGESDHDLINLFSTHSYNQPAAGYAGKTQNITKTIRENHPLGKSIPVIYTEIGRWMNAYLIDKEETMDSPSLFTEWAGIYANNMLGGCYGMWAFKFSNTVSSTYPQGIKSGHHHTWKGIRFAEDAFDNLAIGKRVTASGSDSPGSERFLTDGDKSNRSAWVVTADGDKWLEIALGRNTPLGGMAIYTGSAGGEFTAPDRVRSLQIWAWVDNAWKAIEGASETGAKYAQLYYTFGRVVTTDKIRITISDKGRIMVREVKLFGPDTLSEAVESFDVSGAQRTGEVVRLFAKGFKDRRPLLLCERSVADNDLDVLASVDSLSSRVYLWVVNRNARNINAFINLKDLGIEKGAGIVYEVVDGMRYGEAEVLKTSLNGLLNVTIPSQSAGLITICRDRKAVQTIHADKSAVVKGGGLSAKVFGPEKPAVALDSQNGANNQVTYINFNVEKNPGVRSANRILLGVNGLCRGDDSVFRFHVYAMNDTGWKTTAICWNNAPMLDKKEALALSGKEGIYVAGELTMNNYNAYHYLDVTDIVKKYIDRGVTFMLIREVREPGDDYDKGRTAEISSHVSPFKPELIVF